MARAKLFINRNVRAPYRVADCGKAKNKRYPYSTVVMRRSLGDYRTSKNVWNAYRFGNYQKKHALPDPSYAKRQQLCQYTTGLWYYDRGAAGAMWAYTYKRRPSREVKCGKKSKACGYSCISTKRKCHAKKRSSIVAAF